MAVVGCAVDNLEVLLGLVQTSESGVEVMVAHHDQDTTAVEVGLGRTHVLRPLLSSVYSPRVKQTSSKGGGVLTQMVLSTW